LKEPESEALKGIAKTPVAKELPVLPPLAALIEIVVLFVLLNAADWLHPGIELADIRPHPYWLPVLLLSLQYGTISGLLAAGVAIALAATAGFPEQTSQETYFAYLLKIWIEPMLWISAAVVLGQFRMRQIALKQELVSQVTELASQRAAIADYASNLRTHCTALERQIAGRSATDTMKVLEAMNTAQQAGQDNRSAQLDETFARVIDAALPGARATLYMADTTGMRVAAVAGVPADGHPRPWIGPTAPLFRAMMAPEGGFSILTPDGEKQLDGEGVAAVPVIVRSGHGTSASRRLVGMLRLDEVDPAALGETTAPALAAIAHAFAPALEARLVRDGLTAVEAAPVTISAATAEAQKGWRHLRWFRGGDPVKPTVPVVAVRAPSSVSN
jgi:hypothetical protein